MSTAGRLRDGPITCYPPYPVPPHVRIHIRCPQAEWWKPLLKGSPPLPNGGYLRRVLSSGGWVGDDGPPHHAPSPSRARIYNMV